MSPRIASAVHVYSSAMTQRTPQNPLRETEASQPPAQPIEIPVERLTREALLGVVDDFILREGTDYGMADVSLDTKRDQVLAQLTSGHAWIAFDPDRQSCTILRR